MKHEALAKQIEALGAAAAADVIGSMYGDAFWMARFGERGRRFADEDCRHHVDHLVQALRADDPGVLVRYARWLQGLLCTRGMCSRHIELNLTRLATAFDRLLTDRSHGAVVTACVAAAVDALLAPSGAPRALQDASPSLGLALARQTGAGWPVIDDAASLLSYLADAMVLERPELFANHWRFLVSFQQLSPARAAEVKSALVQALVDHPAAADVVRAA